MLEDLLSPTLVFVLFYSGLMLIGFELVSPGVSIPGVAGVLALVTAFIGFGTLPVRFAGVVLLLASVGFFLLEAKYPGLSFAALGGVTTLVLGGFLLIDPRVGDPEGVSPWAIVPIALGAVVFFAFVIPAGLKARRLPSSLAHDNLVGAEGIATTDLDPRGIAHVGAESWSAESIGGSVAKGQRVRVVKAEGLWLKVEPLESGIVQSSETGEMTELQGS